MASKKSSNGKAELPQETSASLAAEVEKFLSSGGKIQEIPQGVSGQVATSGPRHITLGRRRAD